MFRRSWCIVNLEYLSIQRSTFRTGSFVLRREPLHFLDSHFPVKHLAAFVVGSERFCSGNQGRPLLSRLEDRFACLFERLRIFHDLADLARHIRNAPTRQYALRNGALDPGCQFRRDIAEQVQLVVSQEVDGCPIDGGECLCNGSASGCV